MIIKKNVYEYSYVILNLNLDMIINNTDNHEPNR